MRKYGMPERINEEVFVAMAKALDFIDPGKSDISIILSASAFSSRNIQDTIILCLAI